MGNYLSQKRISASEKFAAKDGLTLYDNALSPAAQRVRITLIEKDAKWNRVEVDLVKGENFCPEYKKINANAKVPALSVKGVKGLPDCCLFESNVITEFLDSTLKKGATLYPDDPWLRSQVYVWQDWELGLIDDFVPLMYNNIKGTVLRLRYPTIEAAIKSFHNMPSNKRHEHTRIYEGTWKTHEEIENHAIQCYKHLVTLEEALEGKSYLVGNKFSIADVSVFPRVDMYSMNQLPIDRDFFPNICAYKDRLWQRKSFRCSQSWSAKLLQILATYFFSMLVFLANWRSGKNIRCFNGRKLIKRAFEEDVKMRAPRPLPVVNEEDIIIFNYPQAMECWQIKLLLMEKGSKFDSYPCDFLDLFGRGSGSGGLFRIQHGGRLVTGMRAVLEYLDSTVEGEVFFPSDPVKRAQAKCWQAWEQTMQAMELSSLIETEVLAKFLQKKFPEDEDDLEQLSQLQQDPKHQSRYSFIEAAFLAQAPAYHRVWESKDFYSYGSLDKKQERLKRYFELLHTRLDHLNTELKDKDYLVGEELSIADICVYCRLLIMPHVNMKISTQKYPHLCAWMIRLKEREHFKKVSESVDQVLGGMD